MTVSTTLRGAAVLALALTLAACGGKASFPVTGTVTGLVYEGLVLSTNGMDLAIKPGTTSFSFPNSLSYGEVYNVVQKTAPAHQNCVPTDQRGLAATDTAGRLASINIIVSCSINAKTIGGTVSGLTAGTLVLTNGTAGGTATITAPTTATTTPIDYAFGSAVAYSQSYGVTVLTQPANLFCTVANPTGVMGDANVTNINVSCVPAP
jgi:hypothetical protein